MVDNLQVILGNLIVNVDDHDTQPNQKLPTVVQNLPLRGTKVS